MEGQADGRTDRKADTAPLTVAFRNYFANIPKNKINSRGRLKNKITAPIQRRVWKRRGSEKQQIPRKRSCALSLESDDD